MRGGIGLLILAALLSAPASASECGTLDVDALLARVAPTMESHRLGNGLRVHLLPRPGAHSVAVRIAYDVGARDEPTGRGGVAHLFEHMMFKGSPQVPDGGVFRVTAAVGGRTNAMTDYDTTEYWNTVPSYALARVLFVEADRMRELQLTDANLDNQRASILEEGLSLENLPYVDAAASFGVRLWRGTPYGHSPMGTAEELAAFSEAEARDFHAAYYTPGNAVLVVVGGFDPAEAWREIERSFGAVPAGRPRPAAAPVDVDFSAIHAVAHDPLAPFPLQALIWHAVGRDHADATRMSVLDDLLMGHADARLRRGVAQPLALDAYGLPVLLRDVGLLNYVFVPRAAVSVDEIREGVEREIARLLQEGPGEHEVCQSRRRIQRRRVEALGTHEGLAAAVSRGALWSNDPWRFAEELRALDAVDGEGLQRTAERYLARPPSTLEIQPPGTMRFLKTLLEWLPASVGNALEESLL